MAMRTLKTNFARQLQIKVNEHEISSFEKRKLIPV